MSVLQADHNGSNPLGANRSKQMKKIGYSIYPIPRYPDDGNHVECWVDVPFDFPFEVRKGEDIYWYKDRKGKEKVYNGFKKKIDDRWIVNLREDEANPSLIEIFDIKVSKDLNKILKYCVGIYKKSLVMEQYRIQEELSMIKNYE